MQINEGTLSAMYRGFKTTFQGAFNEAPSQLDKIATTVPSSTAIEDYGWMGAIPGMREWVGDRVIHNLSLHTYTIKNKPFELTVGVDRDKIEDEQLGIYTPMIAQMGYEARIHPDKLAYGLLARGFETPCYDGQYFFDTDHPVVGEDGKVVSVSNMQSGSGNPWFLIDNSRPLRPIIWQDRKKPSFVALNQERDANVFLRKEYLYGVDMRGNVGFSLWQMAFGSKAELTADNFEAAMAAMGALTKDGGEPLGIRPGLLLVGSSNLAAAKKIIEAQLIKGGESNINYRAVDLLQVGWLK